MEKNSPERMVQTDNARQGDNSQNEMGRLAKSANMFNLGYFLPLLKGTMNCRLHRVYAAALSRNATVSGSVLDDQTNFVSTVLSTECNLG